MNNVSDAFKKELANGNRTFSVKLNITLTDGTELEITNGDLWQGGFSIEDAVSSDGVFEIGAAIINKLSFTINNISEGFSDYDFSDAEVSPHVGITLSDGTTERCWKGVFTVDEVKYNGSLITISCLDYMAKFDKDYSDSTIEYPSTIQNIVEDACSVCGVSLETTSIPHGDFTVQTRPSDEATTFRNIIQWCAQIAGCYARCNYRGYLEFAWFDQDLLSAQMKSQKLNSKYWEQKSFISTSSAGDSYSEVKLASTMQIATSELLETAQNIIVKANSGFDVLLAYFDSNAVFLGENSGWITDFPLSISLDSTIKYIGVFIRYSDLNSKISVDDAIISGLKIHENSDEVHYIDSIYSTDFQNYDISITGVDITEINIEYDDEGSETEETTTYTSGSEGYVISIDGNELLKNGAADTVASWLGEQLIGFIFRGGTVLHSSDPTFEAGDVSVVIDRKGNTYYFPVSSTTFSTGSSQFTKCNAETPTQNSSIQYTTYTKNLAAAKQSIQREVTAREQAVKSLDTALKNASGLYATEVTQDDGSVISYFHDKPTIEESTNVIKITSEAIGISNDGGETYPYGLTLTGELIAKLIYTVGLNADYINTGAITVKDSDGNIIFQVDFATKTVTISGDHVTIGGKSATQAISDTLSSANSYADTAASNAVSSQTQESIFYKLTNNGSSQGLILQNENLYVNASYIQSGALVVNDSSGNTIFKADKDNNAVQIMGFDVGSGYMRYAYTLNSNTCYVGMGIYGTTYAFFAGGTGAEGTDAPFRVGHDGSLKATNAYITGTVAASTITGGTISGTTLSGVTGDFSGTIMASAGKIANFTIENGYLYNGIGIGTAQSCGISCGSSLSGSDDWIFWAGNGNFRVDINGYANLSNADIAGSINASNITALFYYYLHDSAGTKKEAISAPESSFENSIIFGKDFSNTILGNGALIANSTAGLIMCGADGTYALKAGSLSCAYIDSCQFIELFGATPYIDFHYGSATDDYTSRIIEEVSGTLTCTGNWKTNGAIYAGDKLSLWTDDEGGNINLISPGGVAFQMDAYNENLRIYCVNLNGNYTLGLTVENTGQVKAGAGITTYGTSYFNGALRLQNDFRLQSYTSGGSLMTLIYMSGGDNIWIGGQGAKTAADGDCIITANNVYKRSSGSSTSLSDGRYKKEINDIENAEDFIMGLLPKWYKFTDGTSGRVHSGFLAEDVKKDMDETVGDFGVYVRYTFDENTPIDENDPNTYICGLRYDELIAPHIKVTQMHNVRIAETEARLTAAEAMEESLQYQLQQAFEEIAKLQNQIEQLQAV